MVQTLRFKLPRLSRISAGGLRRQENLLPGPVETAQVDTDGIGGLRNSGQAADHRQGWTPAEYLGLLQRNEVTYKLPGHGVVGRSSSQESGPDEEIDSVNSYGCRATPQSNTVHNSYSSSSCCVSPTMFSQQSPGLPSMTEASTPEMRRASFSSLYSTSNRAAMDHLDGAKM